MSTINIRRSTWWVLASYIVIVLFVFGKALWPVRGMMIYGDDIAHQYYFFREYFNVWITKGIIPWWNPYLFSGQPFVADPMVNLWYPGTWLFIVLPLPLAYSWHLAVHVVWAMLGMRKLTKSWVSGLLFGLSGFFMARTWAGHVDVIAAASWIPWVVWASLKFQVASNKEYKRSLVIASFIFTLQLLAGYQTMAFMTVLIVGIAAVGKSYMSRTWQPVLRAILAGVVGVGLAAIQIIPEQEFFRSSIRTITLPYSWVSYGSWMVQSLIQLLNPFYFGNQYTYGGPPPNFVEHSAFVGITGLILAIVGVWSALRAGKKEHGMLFGLIAVFGIWVSLGSHAPIDLQYLLWKIIPMYHYLRIPSRHLILVCFGLAGLAGIGFRRVPRSLRSLIVCFVVIEMVVFGRQFIEIRPVPETRENAELITILKRDPQPYRVLQNFGVWLPQREQLEFDALMPHGIFSATGYDTSILRSYYEYVANASGKKGSEAILSQDVQVPYLTPAASEALDFLNIKYIAVPFANDPFYTNTRYDLVYHDPEHELAIYENTTVKPRFFLEKDGCGSVNVDAYTPNQIRLSVRSTCETTLMSSEVWYPGWTATIDGKKVDISRTNTIFRTLFVQSGNHTITYEYQPTIFYIGALVSLLTLISLSAIVFTTRKP